MPNLREQLERMSVTIPDTGDFRTVERFRPRDVAITSSFVTAAVQLVEHSQMVDEAMRWAQLAAGKRPTRDHVVRLAIDWMTVHLGLKILQIIPGRVSFEVDVRLAGDIRQVVERVRWLVNHFDQAGAPRSRILARIPGTWQGIRAAEILEKEGIHTHISLVFGMHQLAAAADARATAVGPMLGRVVDWHRRQSGIESYAAADDPGVSLLKRMYNYLKFHGYGTELVACSFRNVEEVVELAGCDRLLVAPNFLAGLQLTEAPLERRLDPQAVRGMNLPRLSVDEATFRNSHGQDVMAREKLAEGLHGFGRAQVALEKLLRERLDMATDGKKLTLAKEIFDIFDLDGDGLITREEWGGSVSVFDALDTDGDGRITADEVAAGLGAAFRLSEQIGSVRTN